MISFHELKHSLSEVLTQFLWDQWVSIGMAGATRSRPVPFVVDPEVLLLATTRFGMGEARLFGEALDWLAVNGKLLGAQRLKSLHLGSGLGDARVLQAMERHLAEVVPGSPSKLLSFATGSSPSPPLSEWFGDSAFEWRGLSRRPDPGEPEAFLFKMRSFFGINARAEVFSWLLLAGRSGYPAGIARETGWGAKTIQVVLNEMAESGLVSVTEGEREKWFRVAQSDWKFLLPQGPCPVWWCQAPFYEACSTIVRLLDELEVAAFASEAAKAVKIRGVLPGIAKNFILAKQEGRFEMSTSLRGADLVDLVSKETLRLIEDIKDRAELVHSSVKDRMR